MTYRFRINPNARFSDGTPVTSDDVVATYDLMVDKTLQGPVESADLSESSTGRWRKANTSFECKRRN